MTRFSTRSVAKAAPAISQTTSLFAQMEMPLRKTLQGLLRDFEGFADLVTHHLEPGFDQFSGYDGIENRGDLGDILASEWAISDIEPLEFSRRLAMIETLFRRKVYQSNTQGRAVCLIVDSGAWMLGHNRLLGLGAVFWLAAHSERLGFDFYWCHTAQPDNWNRGLEREQIQGYLDRVSQKELTQEDLNNIIQSLPVIEADNAIDLLLVGPAQLEHSLDLTNLRAALLAELPYKAEGSLQASSAVSLWARGGARHTLLVNFPDDGLCIGALRRPFAVVDPNQEVHADYLSDTWVAQHWVELPYGMIAIRWPEGLLISTHFTAQTAGNLWIPLDKTAQIIAIAQEGDLAVRLIWRSGDDRSPVLKMARFDTGTDVASEKVSKLALHGDAVDLDFGTTALPLQFLVYNRTSDTLEIFFDRAGRPFTIEMQTGEVRILNGGPLLLAQDCGDRCMALKIGDARLTENVITVIKAQAYRQFLIGLEDPVEWSRARRDIRITKSQIAVLLSRDGMTYDILEQTTSSDFDWPQGLVPLQFLGPKVGFGYNPTTGGIVQVRAHHGAKPQLHPKTGKGSVKGLSHLRASMAGRSAYGIALQDGQVKKLVGIRFGGKGQGFETLSVEDQIAEARTLWLKD